MFLEDGCYDTLSFYNKWHQSGDDHQLSMQYCKTVDTPTSTDIFLSTMSKITFRSDYSVNEAGFLLNISSVEMAGMFI